MYGATKGKLCLKCDNMSSPFQPLNVLFSLIPSILVRIMTKEMHLIFLDVTRMPLLLLNRLSNLNQIILMFTTAKEMHLILSSNLMKPLLLLIEPYNWIQMKLSFIETGQMCYNSKED